MPALHIETTVREIPKNAATLVVCIRMSIFAVTVAAHSRFSRRQRLSSTPRANTEVLGLASFPRHEKASYRNGPAIRRNSGTAPGPSRPVPTDS